MRKTLAKRVFPYSTFFRLSSMPKVPQKPCHPNLAFQHHNFFCQSMVQYLVEALISLIFLMVVRGCPMVCNHEIIQ